MKEERLLILKKTVRNEMVKEKPIQLHKNIKIKPFQNQYKYSYIYKGTHVANNVVHMDV